MPVQDTSLPSNEDSQEVLDLRPLFSGFRRDPGPDVKMRTFELMVDDAPTSDTAKRKYFLTCRERLLELKENPGPPVEFRFDVSGDDEQSERPIFVLPAFDSLISSVRKKPAASEFIGDKVIDAISQARDDEQIKGFDLYIEVENGRVTLEGDVISVEQQRRVKSIPEVRRLVYRVTVRQPER